MTGIKFHALGEPRPSHIGRFQENLFSVAAEVGIETTRCPVNSLADQSDLCERFIEPYQSMLEAENTWKWNRVFRSNEATYDVNGHVAVTVDGEPVDIATWDTFYASLSSVVEPMSGKAAYDILSKFANKAATQYKSFLDGSSIYDVVVTSHGTIDEQRLTEHEENKFQEFVDNHTVVVMTGWDLSDMGSEIKETYEPDVIVSEGGSVAHRAPQYEHHELFEDLNSVKKGTTAVFKQIDRLLGKEAVLLSQANRASSCFYINPPKELYESKLKKKQAPESCSIENFCLQMTERTDLNPQPIRREGHIGKFDYSEENLYIFEKFQAQERTFQPYRILNISEDSVTFELLSGEVFNQDEYSSLVKPGDDPPPVIASIAYEARKRLSDSAAKRIQPQTDHCIDVFAKRKDEALDRKFWDITGIDYESDNIMYLSKGTRSDLGLIDAFVEYAEKHGTKFAGKATTAAPGELQNHPYVATHDVDSPAEILANIASSNHFKGPISF